MSQKICGPDMGDFEYIPFIKINRPIANFIRITDWLAESLILLSDRECSRDLESMFLERGFGVDHSTVNRWVLADVPPFAKRLRAILAPSLRFDPHR